MSTYIGKHLLVIGLRTVSQPTIKSVSCIDLCFSSACPKSWTFDHSLVDPPAVFLWPHFAIMAHENTHIHNSCTSVTGCYLDTGSVGIKQQMVLYTFIPLSGIVTLWLCSVLVLSSNHRLGLYLKGFFSKMVINLLKLSIINPFLLRKCFLHSSERRRPQWGGKWGQEAKRR